MIDGSLDLNDGEGKEEKRLDGRPSVYMAESVKPDQIRKPPLEVHTRRHSLAWAGTLAAIFRTTWTRGIFSASVGSPQFPDEPALKQSQPKNPHQKETKANWRIACERETMFVTRLLIRPSIFLAHLFTLVSDAS